MFCRLPHGLFHKLFDECRDGETIQLYSSYFPFEASRVNGHLRVFAERIR